MQAMKRAYGRLQYKRRVSEDRVQVVDAMRESAINRQLELQSSCLSVPSGNGGSIRYFHMWLSLPAQCLHMSVGMKQVYLRL